MKVVGISTISQSRAPKSLAFAGKVSNAESLNMVKQSLEKMPHDNNVVEGLKNSFELLAKSLNLDLSALTRAQSVEIARGYERILNTLGVKPNKKWEFVASNVPVEKLTDNEASMLIENLKKGGYLDKPNIVTDEYNFETFNLHELFERQLKAMGAVNAGKYSANKKLLSVNQKYEFLYITEPFFRNRKYRLDSVKVFDNSNNEKKLRYEVFYPNLFSAIKVQEYDKKDFIKILSKIHTDGALDKQFYFQDEELGKRSLFVSLDKLGKTISIGTLKDDKFYTLWGEDAHEIFMREF